MPEPVPALTSLSLGKAGVRALTTLLASEYGPSGIHVATVTVADAVAPGGPFDPTASPKSTGVCTARGRTRAVSPRVLSRDAALVPAIPSESSLFTRTRRVHYLFAAGLFGMLGFHVGVWAV